jgi:O-antigen biosynthesis protein
MIVTVAVPVRDGARYLAELLDAVGRQRIDADVEVLVVDSGSTDGSPDIARSTGATVIEIDPAEFGHGRTRNLAAARSRGDYIAFLTQDATPASDTWLAELLSGFELDERVGMAFGPHLPRTGTSPMIARELGEHFRAFSTNGRPALQGPGDDAFLSNVNSCLRRACWEEIRFRDVPYAEDQAFARDALAAGWLKAYCPGAGVLHAHDFGWGEFMRRYFDEYRGLRATIDHREPFGVGRTLRLTARKLRADWRHMRDEGRDLGERVGWAPRAAAHHAGRALFSALGSRSRRLPAAVQRRLSLEGTAGHPTGRFGGEITAPAAGQASYEAVADRWRQGPSPLDPVSEGDLERSWHIAWLVPPFAIGSGGHMALFTLAELLERRGHTSSIWITDPNPRRLPSSAAVARRQIVEHFAPLRAGVHVELDDWDGADVALATGWQTAHTLWPLDRTKLKAYLAQDYEPDFYPASAQRVFAEETYGLGFPVIASSPWLAETLRDRHGARAEHFDYAADLETYRDLGLERDSDTVVYYTRQATPRRGTDLGVLALEELKRRRPRTHIVVVGDTKPLRTPFDHEAVGVVDAAALARIFNRATVGFVISLTNYSLIPKEMMAAGLAVCDVNGPSARSVFGEPGDLIALPDPNPVAIADELEALLSDPDRRLAQASRAGAYVRGLSWEAAAETVERHLKSFLAERLRPAAP